MGEYDDDERGDAYKRYIFNEFADIIHNYDDTARPDHDNIDYTADDIDHHDGAEYDDDGNPVQQFGVAFIRIGDNIYFVSHVGTGDDDESSDAVNDLFDAWLDAAESDGTFGYEPPRPGYRFPFYNPTGSKCDRRHNFHYGSGDTPPV